MSKFIFYQTIDNDSKRANFGFMLERGAIGEALEDIYLNHKEDDVISVGILGITECDRFIPLVLEKVSNIPTDAEDPESAVLAVELDYPAGMTEKARTALKELEGTEALYYYMEHFIITDESLELSKPRWEGDTLEAMEKWLEDQADLMAAEK